MLLRQKSHLTTVQLLIQQSKYISSYLFTDPKCSASEGLMLSWQTVCYFVDPSFLAWGSEIPLTPLAMQVRRHLHASEPSPSPSPMQVQDLDTWPLFIKICFHFSFSCCFQDSLLPFPLSAPPSFGKRLFVPSFVCGSLS